MLGWLGFFFWVLNLICKNQTWSCVRLQVTDVAFLSLPVSFRTSRAWTWPCPGLQRGQHSDRRKPHCLASTRGLILDPGHPVFKCLVHVYGLYLLLGSRCTYKGLSPQFAVLVPMKGFRASVPAHRDMPQALFKVQILPHFLLLRVSGTDLLITDFWGVFS